eukprot:669343-Lingulodinium_polyedra.AAC.1
MLELRSGFLQVGSSGDARKPVVLFAMSHHFPAPATLGSSLVKSSPCYFASEIGGGISAMRQAPRWIHALCRVSLHSR